MATATKPTAGAPLTLVGRRAPEFEVDCTTAPGSARRRIGLGDFADRWLILIFYPADFSLICPTELAALSSRYEEFAGLGADILAISTDTVETHERWIAAPRSQGGLGPVRFRLGSDVGGEVSTRYGVYVPQRRLALRGLFVIDPNSIVQYEAVHNLSVGRRSDEIFRVLTALQTGGLCAENWQPGRGGIDPTESLGPGSRISHYRIEERIGAGAFATVYRAYDTNLGRMVALKVLKPREGQPPSVQAEARAAAALNHPNVCTVHGIDDSEGVAMIVMEHLIGEPLSRIIEGGPTPPPRVAAIGRQIASGMAAAHALGITHGDLKPANIMLTSERVVKILDFGLSFRQPLSGASDSTVYVDSRVKGAIAGTPGYMSPEQAGGHPATPASDVFALGLVLYELLRGARLFGDMNILQALSEIRRIDPEPLAAASPPPFDALLRQMLARDPQRRTIDMEEIEAALAAVGP